MRKKVVFYQNVGQNGFTLLELMVALAIFAILAIAGWQIMNSLIKSRDHTKTKVQQLSELQYAYLQLSQDFAQTVNYVAVPVGINKENKNQIQPTFSLKGQEVRFIRFANPDPRLTNPPVLTRIEYALVEDKLIKYRYYDLQSTTENPATSVLLTGMSHAKWLALTPDIVSNFPDAMTLQQVQDKTNAVNLEGSLDLFAYQQLPKGIELQFNYYNQPIVWRFALPPQAPNQVVLQNKENQN